MKVSILLPTRDRLEYLKYAVESVLRQESPNWELVISDNSSSEDVGGYVDSIADDRVAFVATERPVPVTDNWNHALDASTGDYVVMLGDDDGLLPGYVGRVLALAESFSRPDLLYTSAMLLVYPGVRPDNPRGGISSQGYASFMRGRIDPFELSPRKARAAVAHAMAFRLRFGFNMQFSVVSRALVTSMAAYGPFYQSRFPDYYATNAAFLKARRIVVDPVPLMVIGVTPKSYGYFHARKREDEGSAFLQAETGAGASPLPGTNINVGWLDAMETLERRMGAEFGLRVSRRRYRWLQAAWVYEHHHFSHQAPPGMLDDLNRRLSWLERLAFRALTGVALVLRRVLAPRLRRSAEYVWRRLLRQFPHWKTTPLAEGKYANLPALLDDHGEALLLISPQLAAVAAAGSAPVERRPTRR